MRAVFLSCLACTVLLSAETAVIDVSIGDVPALEQAFTDSYWGRLVAPDMHAAWSGLSQDPPFDNAQATLNLISGVTAVRLQVFPGQTAGGSPGLQIRIDGPAVPLRELLALQLPRWKPGHAAASPSWDDRDDHLLIVFGLEPQPIATPAAHEAVHFSFAGPQVAALLRGLGSREAALAADIASELLGNGSGAWLPTAAGLRQELQLDWTPAGLIALDQSLLARFPGNNFGALGFDVGAWWKAHGERLLALLAKHYGEAEVQRGYTRINNLVTGMLQRPGGLEQFLDELRGTSVLSVDIGGNFAVNLSLTLPRTRAVDDLLRMALAFTGNTVPEEGAFTWLNFPHPKDPRQRLIPGSLVLGCDPQAWILSIDPLFVEDFLAGRTGGWSQTPLADQLKASSDPVCACSANDLRSALRILPMYLGAAANIPALQPHAEALLKAGVDLARQAQPGSAIASLAPNGLRAVAEGPLPFAVLPGDPAVIAIIAAIAVPNLLESRITANEAATAATLKSGLFPALLQFQAGGYEDRDNDNRGEYGFLPELYGARPTPGGQTLRLLGSAAWANGEINGYRYAVYLPSGPHSAVDQSQRGRVHADLAEQFYVVYAWPARFGDSGRRTFAITQAGTVYSLPAPRDFGPEGPAWNDLFGGGTWGDQPAGGWIPYRR